MIVPMDDIRIMLEAVSLTCEQLNDDLTLIGDLDKLMSEEESADFRETTEILRKFEEIETKYAFLSLPKPGT